MQGTRSSSQICFLSLVLAVVILSLHFFKIATTYERNKHASKHVDIDWNKKVNWIKRETLQTLPRPPYWPRTFWARHSHGSWFISLSCKTHVMLLILYSCNMAVNDGSSLKWQELLPEHPVFQRLSQRHDDANSGTTEGSQQRITNNILIENDGEIFLWDSSKSSILTANLKNLHFENERSDKFQVSEKFI